MKTICDNMFYYVYVFTFLVLQSRRYLCMSITVSSFIDNQATYFRLLYKFEELKAKKRTVNITISSTLIQDFYRCLFGVKPLSTNNNWFLRSSNISWRIPRAHWFDCTYVGWKKHR